MPVATRKLSLTDRSLKALKPDPGGHRLTVWDSLMPGMAVRISPLGRKSFYAVKRQAGRRQPSWVCLGHYPPMALADARRAARDALLALLEGKHPTTLAEAKRRALEAANDARFENVAERFLREYAPRLRSAKTYAARVRRELIPAFGPTPITDGGGGYQGFWRLDALYEVTVNDNVATLESYNRGLARKLGGDSCHNIDRLMRLPGAINLPNERKRQKGRVPVLAKVVEADWSRVYALDRFTPDEGASGSSRSDEGSRAHDSTRSGKAFRRGLAMRRAGRTFDEFREALKANRETTDWYVDKGKVDDERPLYRIWNKAAESGVGLDDFHAYMPMHSYIFAPTREMWPATSVNARIPPVPLVDENGLPTINKKGEPVKIEAHRWLDKNRPVEQMTWWPGMPELIEDRLTSHAGWIERQGVRVFNLYRGPAIVRGDANLATPWLRHLRRVFPAEHRHLARFLAHRVQRPGDKINHAIVLGGAQGIGKDTLLEPVKLGVGPWNWHEISPADLTGQFNGFAKSVVLRINEGNDRGSDLNRYEFYEAIKVYTAAPPDLLRVNEKYLRQFYIPNVCGIIITTNHKTDGIYLPADDRRHFVAWSNLTKEEFEPEYWNKLWGWYNNGGLGHVVAYLAELDISDFDPKAPPPKTHAWWAIVDAGRPSEDAELGGTIEAMGEPEAFVLRDLYNCAAPPAFADWLRDRKNRRVIPHRMEAVGYVPMRNPDANSGLWVVDCERQVVYVRANLTMHDQLRAIKERQSRCD
jgi:Arm DNA-binding domain/Family of unknown function (DUF5906)